MCDTKEITKCAAESYMDSNNNCSSKIITEKYIWQYRDFKGRHCPDEEIDVSLCQHHYEWLYLANEDKKREFIKGRDITEAVGDDLCSVFDLHSYNGSYLYEFWYNTITRKVILINGITQSFYSFMLDRNFQKKGSFYYNGKFVIELSPLTWEIICFRNQLKDAKDAKNGTDDADDKNNYIYHFVIDNDTDTDTKKDGSETYNFKPFTIEDETVLDKWIEDRYIFEKCLNFINDNMRLTLFNQEDTDIDYIEDVADDVADDLSENVDVDVNAALAKAKIDYDNKIKKANMENEFLFRDIIQLEEILVSTTLVESLVDILEVFGKGKINLKVLWIIYVKHNHRLHSPDETKVKLLTDNGMLINLFIKFCTKEELDEFLRYAIEGCRNEITYKQRDFYDYIHPNLYVVKRLVPRHINHKDIILTIDTGNDIKSFTPLEFWHYTTNYTWAIYGAGEEHRYKYDKDETIREYLESLNV